jgi:hypothetical protein
MSKLAGIRAGMSVRLYGDRFPVGHVTGTVIDIRSGITRMKLDGVESPEALVYEPFGSVTAVVWGTTHRIDRVEVLDDDPEHDETDDDCTWCGGVGGEAPHRCASCRGTGKRAA